MLPPSSRSTGEWTSVPSTASETGGRERRNGFRMSRQNELSLPLRVGRSRRSSSIRVNEERTACQRSSSRRRGLTAETTTTVRSRDASSFSIRSSLRALNSGSEMPCSNPASRTSLEKSRRLRQCASQAAPPGSVLRRSKYSSFVALASASEIGHLRTTKRLRPATGAKLPSATDQSGSRRSIRKSRRQMKSTRRESSARKRRARQTLRTEPTAPEVLEAAPKKPAIATSSEVRAKSEEKRELR